MKQILHMFDLHTQYHDAIVDYRVFNKQK